MRRLLFVLLCIVVFGAAALFLWPQSIRTGSNTYSSSLLGVSVTKPESWVVGNQESWTAKMDNADVSDVAVKKAVSAYAATPLVVFYKQTEPYNAVNATFKLMINPIENLVGGSPAQTLAQVLDDLKAKFEAFEILEPIAAADVAGRSGQCGSVQYTLGGPHFVRSKLCIVTRGPHYFLVMAGNRKEPEPGSLQELESVLKSIVLESR